MDPRLYRQYDQELKFLREMGVEFAREFPKVAGRLGIDGIEAKDCADPYVERLLEGAAFLAARVQLQLKLEYPRFSEQLLQTVFPSFLTPTPSMAIAEMRPQLADSVLATGFRVPRGSSLKSPLGKDESVPCEFRTAHDVTLWPLEIKEARYFGTAAGLGLAGLSTIGNARAGLRLTFAVTAGLKASQLTLENLDLYLSGPEQLPRQIQEMLLSNALGFVVRSRDGAQQHVFGAERIAPLGYGEREALLPPSRRSFSGYRLLQEYFAFPERFLFVRLDRLRQALSTIEAGEFEIIFLFDRPVANFESAVTADNFRLHATPIINLFQRRADRIQLGDRVPEYHLVVDRTHPMDFEVHDVVSVQGFGTRSEAETTFQPFYGTTETTWHAQEQAFFTLRREPRVLSARQRKYGPRSSYQGSEVFVSLSDARSAPFNSDLRQLECTVLCTNRDLPLTMAVGRARSDLRFEGSGPIESIRIAAGPTRPRPAMVLGEGAWRLISHLSLSYGSLLDSEEGAGPAALRELLSLYSDSNDPVHRRQIEGVRSVATRPVIARLAGAGPVAVGRGIEIILTLEDGAFEGSGAFLLGAVLEEFFARYVSINSFTRTVLRTSERGEIKRWPNRSGRRPSI
jgi:type VI secretion system protein ImpG